MGHRAPMTAAGFGVALAALVLPVALAVRAPAAGSAVRPGPPLRSAVRAAAPITHVVVIVQENRTVDNLFQMLPGANTQRWGLNKQGQHVSLRPTPLNIKFDPVHNHLPNAGNAGGFATEYDNGANDGWESEVFSCGAKKVNCPHATAYAYVEKKDVANYYDIAHHYAFNDMTQQVNEGPSFPAHQYLIAGQSGGLYDTIGHLSEAENPKGTIKDAGKTGGCDNKNYTTQAVDMELPFPGAETGVFPCEDYQTIFDLMDAEYPSVQYSWRYYMPSETTIWSAPIGVQHLYQKYLSQGGPSGHGNFAIDPGGSVFQSDVNGGTLPPLSYVVPCSYWSDHPGSGSGLGPDWVSFLENTIGESAYWKNTAIVIVWDDWGGWYDHVVPGHTPNVFNNPLDPYEYGYRVPLMVVSPYARAAFVDHTAQTQMAILAFIEKVFALPNLGAADQLQYAGSDLTPMFNFNRNARTYHPEPIPTGLFPQTDCPKNQPDVDG